MSESGPLHPGAPALVEAEALLLGADVGGTATRVALATLAGEVLGVAAGPAGNPYTVGLTTAAQRIRTTVEQALAAIGRPGLSGVGGVRAAVVGLAGGSRGDDTFLAAALPAAVRAPSRLVSDLSVAFNSATPLAEGYVLIAGTGAVAGRIRDGDLQERRDGWGWLLGDEGSGFWLGRESVRATLRTLESGEPLGPLAEAVVELAGTADPTSLIKLCYVNPPAWLATFGPLVSRHAEDPAAFEIAERAAGHLHATLLALGLRSDLPVVLSGSVATRPGPVRAALDRRLRASLANPVLTAESGLVGALWLAAREVGVTDQQIHARLGLSLGRASGTVV